MDFIKREKNLLKKETQRKGESPQFWLWVSNGDCVTKSIFQRITRFFFPNEFVELRSSRFCSFNLPTCWFIFTVLGFPAVSWLVDNLSFQLALQDGIFPFVCFCMLGLRVHFFYRDRKVSLIQNPWSLQQWNNFFFNLCALREKVLAEQFLVKAYSSSSRGAYLHETNMWITKMKPLVNICFSRTLSGSILILGLRP